MIDALTPVAGTAKPGSTNRSSPDRPVNCRRIDDLPLLRYGAIIADPPWEFKTYSEKGLSKSPDRHYKTMPLEEICALRIDLLAAPGCLLFLWTTWPMIEKAFEVLRAWRFTYVTAKTDSAAAMSCGRQVSRF